MDLESEPHARARWLGVVLILLALAALIWQAWLADHVDELPPAAPVASAGRVSLSEMLGSVDGARMGLQAASAVAATAAAAKLSLAVDEVDVCGLGRVKADKDGHPKDMEPMQLAAHSARARLLPALLNGPDEASRAAGLLLQSVNASGHGDAALPANTTARDALAQMAVASRSPQVYAWALRACQSGRSEGRCRLLNSEQWVRLEPGNAVAWLQVAVDAQSRNDPAAVAEAMYRVSHASRADTHWGTLTGLALARLPPDTPPLAKGALAEELMAAEAGFMSPHLIASQYCSEAGVRDVNRRQVCSAAAEVFHVRGTSLTDVGMAATLGERVGWATERVDAARDERDAVLQVYSRRAAAVRERWSCPALEQTVRHLAAVSQQGEMVAMRQALKTSPESASVLARRYREAAAKPPADSASVTVAGR